MSAMFEVSRKSLVDQVSEGLVDFILSERLQEGDSLPSTADLSTRFGVSRTVVREAVAELSARGILIRSHGREAVVSTPGSGELAQLLSFRVRRDNLSLTDVQDIREGVETQTARLAAQRRTQPQLKRMQTCIDAMDAAADDMAFHEADVAFHREIAEASANQLLLVLLDALAPLLLEERIRATAGRAAAGESRQPILDGHQEIFAGISARDPDAAKRAMEDHLYQVRRGLEAAKKRARTR